MIRLISIFTLLSLAFLTVPATAQQQALETLTLEQALERALGENRTLKASEYEKQSADWAEAQSVSGYLPKVYFVSSWTRLDDETVDRANQGYEMAKQFGQDAEKSAWEDMYKSYFQVTQPIFNGGAEISAIMAADRQRKERKFKVSKTRLDTVRNVKTAYFAALTAEQMVAASEESMGLADESLKIAQARYELGQVDKSEVLRWESSYAEAEVGLIEAQNGRETAWIVLANLIGAALSERFALAQRTDQQISDDLIAAAETGAKEFPAPSDIGGHPAVKQIDQAVGLAKVDRFSSVGNMLPRANFSYQYSWLQNDTMDLDDRESWTAGIQVEIPLFQSLGGVFGIAKSQKSVRASQSSREDFVRGFLQQYHLAQLTIRSAKKSVLAAQKSESFAAQSLEIVKGRHKVGMASNLNLLDAQFAYTRSRSETIRKLGDFYSALADYEYFSAKAEQE
jgi:outer membrane protein